MTSDPRQAFIEAVERALRTNTLVKVTLGAPCGPDPTLRNVRGRPVELSAGRRLQLVWRHDTRVITQNYPFEEGAQQIAGLLGEQFRSGHLFTPEGSLQVERRKKGWRMSKGKAQHTAPSNASHDRDKQRATPLDPRWMKRLGILDAQGRPKRGMERKRRQILRFTEVLAHMLDGSPIESTEERPFRVVDMGCGKGYLTFAAFELLRHRGVAHLEVRGIEVRSRLAKASEAVARELEFEGLTFDGTAIEDAPLDDADLVIALHACDTATDDALARGVAAGARWMMAAPCCHREIRPQLQGPPEMSTVVAHGILATRTAEIATDALRAALLETAGYRSKIFEFVGSEHTDKNLMITAHRRRATLPEAENRARDLARFYGISQQRLAGLLGFPLG